LRLPNVAHYLVIDPDECVLIHHRRSGKRIDTTILCDGRGRLDPPKLDLDAWALFESVRS